MSTVSNHQILHLHLHFTHPSLSPKHPHSQNLKFLTQTPKVSVSNSRHILCCQCKARSYKDQGMDEGEKVLHGERERPSFDINLAVVLAGFAFEAYCSPPENVGTREVDSGNCQTVFLSEIFLREVYDGQLFLKLKNGVNFPAMDPWGTSDPYVVMQLDGQVVKSKIKWATKDPTWNEDFTLNIKIPTTKSLQVAAWDANLVTPHKRMGNAGINLESLCDGNLHEVMMELEGLGGGGRIHLEVKYRSFDEIDEGKTWWRVPYISGFLASSGLESTFKKFFGSDTVKAQQFVQYAFAQIKLLNDAHEKDQPSQGQSFSQSGSPDVPLEQEVSPDNPQNPLGAVGDSEIPLQIENKSEMKDNNDGLEYRTEDTVGNDSSNNLQEVQINESKQSDAWKTFADVVNQTVVQKLGFPVLEKVKFDGFDLLNRIGIESKKIAEAEYIDSGLATSETQVGDIDKVDESIIKATPPSLPDMKKLSWDVLRQTDSVLGALMVLNTAFSHENRDTNSVIKTEVKHASSGTASDGDQSFSSSERAVSIPKESSLDQRKADEMKALFSTAESAMEAWAMLATSLGHSSFIKSEFEKICFLDNASTDTQVAIWRDTSRKRLVIAFRGTEQTRWKDLVTDLMLVPAGLNPERLGGDFKQEVQVHSGFLSAYDSVRIRLLSLIKLSIGFVDDNVVAMPKWHIYVTGHSLGGALATLLALELSSSQMAKNDAISVTMYNFGSPRVGNRRFVDVYNEIQGGGNAGNALTCAACLGLTPRLISKVVDDALGKGILEELEADGVDTSFFVVSNEGNSPLTYVIVDKQTKTRTCIHTPLYPPMMPDDLPQSTLFSALDSARLVYFDGRLHETALVIGKEASQKRIPILVDAEKKREGLDDLLKLADYVVCSARFPQQWTEAPSIASALVSMLLRLPNVKFVIATLGEDGCIMLERSTDESLQSEEMDIDNMLELLKQSIDGNNVMPTCISSKAVMSLKANKIGALNGKLHIGTAEKIPASELIDTTGAGDAFIGAVLYALCAGKPPEKMLPFAASVAAAACRSLGARTGLPKRTDPCFSLLH